ncbi:L-aminopeptidase/D-esterase-like protein [Rhodovulum iodosum]|uniref:L-aminopeptidase/D-esterase-like protein n=1 Tax=Rhodovulum iodosum TaxID=68291 RepID=A0ABV3XQ04_9RHOB|nr:P1 family peptidase [Rhodovulum robiginosum]RSK31308.1 peptidase S58 family protein [Rhodovulum robiginosum]
MRPGARNLITDVAGLQVGQAEDHGVKTGVSVVLGAAPFVAAVHVMGGAPGTRETELLAPDRLVQEVDALVLAGGSAFGLDAASGVADGLRAQGRGFAVGGQRVPIVPGAILFDLLNGGDKGWAENPYKALGRAALDAAGTEVALGSAGAGTGAMTADLKGGLGSASLVLDGGITVGALVAVNALGSAVMGGGPEFWAAPFEMETEFGGLGAGRHDPGAEPRPEAGLGQATTIAIVATDAALTQAEATRLAVAAHDGMARALVPSHTPFDGDLVFAAATGALPLPEGGFEALRLGHAAAVCLARAIARGVYHAASAPGDPKPCWQARFAAGGGRRG